MKAELSDLGAALASRPAKRTQGDAKECHRAASVGNRGRSAVAGSAKAQNNVTRFDIRQIRSTRESQRNYDLVANSFNTTPQRVRLQCADQTEIRTVQIRRLRNTARSELIRGL